MTSNHSSIGNCEMTPKMVGYSSQDRHCRWCFLFKLWNNWKDHINCNHFHQWFSQKLANQCNSMQFHAIPCQIISCIQLICQLPTAINCCIKITCLWYVNRHDIVEWNCARGVTFFVLVISHYFIRWKIWNSVSRRIILLERLTERLQPLVNKFFFFVIICVVSLWDVNYGSKQNINTKPWMEKNLSCVLNGSCHTESVIKRTQIDDIYRAYKAQNQSS